MNHYTVIVSVAPAIEPVSLDEMKLHLRVDHSDEDTLIAALISAAREQAEAFTNRAFIEQTLILRLNKFPEVIKLPRPPLISLTSIAYLDGSGVSQTLSSGLYRLGSSHEPARITEAYGQTWPTTYDVEDAVTVTYKAGYGTAATSVPASIKAAIKLIVEALYENRGDLSQGITIQEIPMTSRSLLHPFKVWL